MTGRELLTKLSLLSEEELNLSVVFDLTGDYVGDIQTVSGCGDDSYLALDGQPFDPLED